jgi:hypothetical protein
MKSTHYKSGFGQRYCSSTSSTPEFKNRSAYKPKLLAQEAHIRAGLGPARARHNIINLLLENPTLREMNLVCLR